MDVNEDKGRETEKALKAYSESMFMNGDITNKASIKGIVDDVVNTYGRLDILVNNAHVSKQVPMVETTDEVMALSFNTGFYPTFHFMQECYPHLKAAKGKVINFASGAGLSGMVNQASYAAAKEAIRGLSRVAANEWGADGINVNLISPIALTPGVEQWKQAFPEAYQEMVDKIPLKNGRSRAGYRTGGRVLGQLRFRLHDRPNADGGRRFHHAEIIYDADFEKSAKGCAD